ncbi:uncharacterized protein OCT59_004404 [Rhizophagus irregularis]|uniref:uncharacterized protein n=1 Tax=Rhizophagus irregularis TaxID=588596 RepID=UPI00331C4EB6|nr:hypothetical protein OCT59_004404 [Rhizophagus irregularis]
MNISNQNLDTTEITLRNNSKTDAKNLWKEIDNDDEEYQYHATIFSTDSTTESDETISYLKKVNIMDLEKRKEIYGVCGECNEPGHFHASNTVICFGITQDPNTKDYMMVLDYHEGGNLRNTLVKGLDYKIKIRYLFQIIDGLSGMCQPVNNEEQSVKKGIYGVLSYMAPEVLHGYQYTKAADIYSFGIIMNEFMSEEITYNDISHDNNLAVKICKGFRPKISEDTPKLIADLIIKCWDAKAENRPTAKELRQIIFKYDKEKEDENSEISYQIKECEKIKKNKLKNRKNKNKSKNLQTHPQAIYTSRLLNFENLPEPVNSTDYLSSFQETISSSSANSISECLDCELNELDLNQDDNE